MAKSMKKMFEMDDKSNGFSYDQTDGVQDARFVGVWKGSEKDFGGRKRILFRRPESSS